MVFDTCKKMKSYIFITEVFRWYTYSIIYFLKKEITTNILASLTYFLNIIIVSSITLNKK